MAGFFNTKLAAKKKLRTYQKSLEQKQEYLKEIKGIETPQSVVEREELSNQIRDLEIKIQETTEEIENKQFQYEPDFFND